jgi:hypothetical protein
LILAKTSGTTFPGFSTRVHLWTDLIVADVIDGIVDCENDVFSGRQQVSIVHDVYEIQQSPIFTNENVN